MKNFLFILGIALAILSCSSNTNSQNRLEPLKTVKLTVSEPSGITFYNNHLYIVSDYNGVVYKTGLEGNIVSKISTPYKDLEGITFNNEGEMFVVNETKRNLVKLDSLGNFIHKFRIAGNQEHRNSGLEGVCFNSLENCFYLVNEKLPKQLLKVNFEGKIMKKFKLPYTDDASGIYYEQSSNSLWLVSDESKKIFNISVKGKLIESYKIPVSKAEGIVIHNNEIYVVCDSENKLYIFKKPK